MSTKRYIILFCVILVGGLIGLALYRLSYSGSAPTPECTATYISTSIPDVTPKPENTPTPETPPVGKEPPIDSDVIPETYNSLCIPIKKAEDQKKKGDVHSRIGHIGFSMNGRTDGISPDVVRFVFDKRAEIVGILVSIDHTDPQITLFEFQAMLNAPDSGYGANKVYDTLLHTSFFCAQRHECNRNTDEHIWFGKHSGIEVGPGEWISFGAWMINENVYKADVHPEFIIWYRWLE